MSRGVPVDNKCSPISYVTYSVFAEGCCTIVWGGQACSLTMSKLRPMTYGQRLCNSPLGGYIVLKTTSQERLPLLALALLEPTLLPPLVA